MLFSNEKYLLFYDLLLKQFCLIFINRFEIVKKDQAICRPCAFNTLILRAGASRMTSPDIVLQFINYWK